MSRSFNGPITDLLPHRATMLLVDALLDDSQEHVRVETTVRRDGLYLADEGLPGWVGIELMAQTVACWAGMRRLERHQNVQLGFLLGTRKYDCQLPFFPIGARLEIHAHLEFVSEQGLAVFVCSIFHEGQVVATGNLNVFQPDNVDEFLKGALNG